jgi:hypothetical protein
MPFLNFKNSALALALLALPLVPPSVFGKAVAAPPSVVPPKERVYRNRAYGFSFRYPASLTLKAYTPASIAVGRLRGGRFQPVAEIQVLESLDDLYPNATYRQFLLERSRMTCAADGPGMSLRCTDALQIRPFRSATGLTGETFSLKLEKTNPRTGAWMPNGRRGPFYAFNLTAIVPGRRHAALLVSPPLSGEPGSTNPALLRSIAGTVTIERLRRK